MLMTAKIQDAILRLSLTPVFYCDFSDLAANSSELVGIVITIPSHSLLFSLKSEKSRYESGVRDNLNDTMDSELKFPEGFLWGSATSSNQVEGGIVNNDWSEAARAGRIPDAGRACDHYNHYKEDFDIARELGQNAHRFSIEWSRIEPEEGKFDDREIEHYRQVLSALKERGLEPMVTLWHYTLPLWFSKMGGFENQKSPEYFSRYCAYVVEKMGDIANFWITINEPMVYASFGYNKAAYPPFKKNFLTLIKVVDNLVTSHNMTYRKIKKIRPELSVGIAKEATGHESNHNPINIIKSSFIYCFWNQRFLRRISKSQDFIGLNYYMTRRFGIKESLEKTDMGWEIYPRGIYQCLVELKQYNKPIYITENGLADATDTKRAKFIKDHLYWVHRAIQDGVNIRGYLYWSLLDNFEWAKGFDPRFGLVEVDYNTMVRTIRPSAYEYKKICEANSLLTD